MNWKRLLGPLARIDTSEYGWKQLLVSLIAGGIAYGIALAMVWQAAPPEGTKFERLPPLTGKYACCGSGRYSESLIDGVYVRCKPISFFEYGTGRNDCGFRNELNGQVVTAIQAFYPSLNERSPVTVQISSGGKYFLNRTDEQIRHHWIESSLFDAGTVGFTVTILVVLLQLFAASFRKSKRTEK